MKYDVLQILGAVLTVFGGQGAIRILFDHANTGLLAFVPGGFAGRLAAYAVVAAAGVLLAGWAHGKAKAAGRRG